MAMASANAEFGEDDPLNPSGASGVAGEPVVETPGVARNMEIGNSSVRSKRFGGYRAPGFRGKLRSPLAEITANATTGTDNYNVYDTEPGDNAGGEMTPPPEDPGEGGETPGVDPDSPGMFTDAQVAGTARRALDVASLVSPFAALVNSGVKGYDAFSGDTQDGEAAATGFMAGVTPTSAEDESDSSYDGVGSATAGGFGAGVDSATTTDGGASSSDGGSVICSEMFRGGEMPRRIYFADMKFARDQLSSITVRGYQWWGIPTVRLIRRNPRARAFWRFIAVNRAEAVAYRLGVTKKPNYVGSLIRLLFEPTCFCIGLFVGEQDWKALYGDRHVT